MQRDEHDAGKRKCVRQSPSFLLRASRGKEMRKGRNKKGAHWERSDGRRRIRNWYSNVWSRAYRIRSLGIVKSLLENIVLLPYNRLRDASRAVHLMEDVVLYLRTRVENLTAV